MRVLLFSGGIESTALAYWRRPDLLLTIDYGQRPAAGELRAASHLASQLDLPHEVVTANVGALGSGDMVGRGVASHSTVSEAWPFRNQFLVTVAAMACAGRSLKEITVGTVISDRVHPDGNPEFVGAIDALIRCELPDVCVTAPAINMTTVELVRESGLPQSMLRWTFSCHRESVGCGRCRGCTKTLETFAELGLHTA